MESKHKFVSYPVALNTLKIQAVAKLAGIELDFVSMKSTDPNFQDHIEKSPTGTLPYIETKDGILSESTAILYWLGQKGELTGKNDFEQMQVHQWINFALDDIPHCSLGTLYPIFGWIDIDQDVQKKCNEYLKKFLKSLDTHLKGKKFLVGENLTIADIELWSKLKHHWTLTLPTELRKKLCPNVDAWFLNIAQNECILNTFGPTHLCKVVQKPPVKHHEKEEKKPEKKEEEKKPKKEQDEDDEIKEEKQKDPLSLLPPSSFDFDSFKKEFLNTNEKVPVMKKFWESYYDQEGYSLYKVRYDKTKNEGKDLLKTKNMSSFFIQKFDTYRKYCFAAFGVYGEEGNYDIRGVFCWRGNGIPFFMSQNESFEFYEKTKLDNNKEEDRKLIESYWLNITPGEDVDGMKVAYVEMFK